ncbi:hypothetical protein [Longimicrobium sp.]|uniref:LuxE/PaaK family acyltransferase n=1 Tax=Longimicrobium sp. TaxID=2029185 RepID=UPI002C4C468D|nr:hypothetical protein [Longimicrobium sp.]HSU16195.1 hypothetical protein [Longimicrobium sp.]
MATTDASELKQRLLSVIARGAHAPLDEAEFDALALGVFAHQYACNAPYRAFCDRRGATPETVRGWAEVPAVPTDAFKATALVCGDPSSAAATFRTSGTTQGSERRGTHIVPDLALYDAALRAGFSAHLLPDGARPRILSLVPSPADLPDSSLSHMIGEVMRDFAAPGSDGFVTPDGGIAGDRLRDALRAAEADGAPVCIPGTAFAFVHWLDALAAAGDQFHLPEGSRVMDTGGFKGRSREVTREELYAAIEDRLGIAPAWCVNEYGMTEMSSQFYDGAAGSALAPSGRLHVGPSWVRTQAADPETLRPLPHGEVGVLRHWDLANLNSVMAIQTADLGFTTHAGFRVLGRARGAEARGCSIAMDELLSAIRTR